MRRFALLGVIGLFMLSASPAFAQTAQTKPQETTVAPDGGSGSSGGSTGTVEPAPPDYAIYPGEIVTTIDGKRVDTGALAGAEVTITVDLVNNGAKDAKDVTLTIEGANPGVTVLDKNANYGDIAKGATAKGDFKFKIDPHDCPEYLSMPAIVRASGMDDQKTELSVSTDCPGPRPYVSEIRYEGGNGDATPDPGETLNVFVTLMNSGHDPASDVRAVVSLEDPNVKLLEGHSTYPDIAGRASAVNETPFVIQIAKDAPRSGGCNFGGPAPRPMEPVATSPDAPVTSSDSGTGSTGPATLVAPAPGTTTPGDEPTQEPDTTSPVGFQAALKITASGKTFDQAFGTQVMCAMMESGAKGGGAVPPGAVAKDLAESVATAGSKTARTSAAVIAAVLALIMTALVVRAVLEKKAQPHDV